MKTETLLLRRSLGRDRSEDCVEWAVERLCDGLDSPSLRILAGLNPRFDRDEIEPYFQKACAELKLDPARRTLNPREAALLVKRGYDGGDLSAAEALETMAVLHRDAQYYDPLLVIWCEIEEELSVRGTELEGYFYPPDLLVSLDAAFRREWTLFETALRLDLPPGFNYFIHCRKCGHVGEPRAKYKTLGARILALIPWIRPRPPLWNACAQCGSYDCQTMTHPEVREAYLKKLEGGE